MISLADFEPLSVAKTLFSSTTGVLPERYFSDKAILLKTSRYKLCCVTATVSVPWVPEVFFLVGSDRIERRSREGEAAKASRQATRKKSPTSTTRSDGRSSPLASEKTSGIQGTVSVDSQV